MTQSSSQPGETPQPTSVRFRAAPATVVPADRPVTGRIRASRICLRGKSASFVRHIEIDVSETPLAGSFEAGQSIGVVLPPESDDRTPLADTGSRPGHADDGQSIPDQPRWFSIASPEWGEDGQGRVLAVTPKRILAERQPAGPDDDPEDHRLIVGRASNYLCDLRPGDPVRLCGPFAGAMRLPAEPWAHNYVFIATGTGVAPFRGMMLQLLRSKDCPVAGEIHLLTGSPYSSDLVYDDVFGELSDLHENFYYHPVISRESAASGESGPQVHHYLMEHRAVFERMLQNPATVLYLCGLAGMESGVFEALRDLGVAERYLLADGTSPRANLQPTGCCQMEVF